MAIETVDFPIKNGGSFHCYVSSPEGMKLSTQLFDIFVNPHGPQNAERCQVPNFQCLVVNSRSFASDCNFRDFGIAMENGSLIDDLNAFSYGDFP